MTTYPCASARHGRLLAGVMLASAALVAAAGAATTINPVNRHAYGANVGWVDARGETTNGVVVGRTCCSGYAWSANAGWIGFGNGPTNGWRYSNASTNDWGVNHDGAGNLAGCAYGANVGWIVFEQTNGRPRVDLLTGRLSGYAWGANVGWISLDSGSAYVQTDVLDDGPDTDGDGMPDAWERMRTGSLTVLHGGGADWDHDGVPDVQEHVADTDPRDGGDYLHITELARREPASSVTWTVAPTRLYRLLQASEVTRSPPWEDSGLGLIEPGGGATLTRSLDEPGVTQRLFRVQALLPLAP